MAKKYPKIEPQFKIGKKGKQKSVYLPYSVYTSIFEEIRDLDRKLSILKNKSKKK